LKPGRKPLPAALHKLHGDPSKKGSAVLAAEPPGVGSLWAPPEWFDERQADQWNYAIENAPPGLLTATDREVLVGWCLAAVIREEASREIQKLGLVVRTKDGNPIQNPYLAIVNRQTVIMMRAGAELGFSPAARASLGSAAPEFGGGGGQIEGEMSLREYAALNPDLLDR
jgi:P27 family predicted phage terminase small subunit